MKKIFSSSAWLAITRILIGFVFLWAFFDKTFGLGFATKRADAWIRGGSPTTGFLSHAAQGPLVDFFHRLAGMVWVDWMFMVGLLFVGITLLINRWVRWGAIAGAVMLVLMYLALLWPANNPFVDDHLVYAAILIYMAIRAEQ